MFFRWPALVRLPLCESLLPCDGFSAQSRVDRIDPVLFFNPLTIHHHSQEACGGQVSAFYKQIGKQLPNFAITPE